MRLWCVLVLSLVAGGCKRPIRRQARAIQPARTTAPAAPTENDGGGRGANKWKDTGVYLDGKPIAALSFGELPVTLEPTWYEEQKSAEKRPHSNDLDYVIVKQRRYRWTDYLKSLGIDLKKVKELHVAGPRWSETIIATGADLRSKKAEGFMFRFGGTVGGKAIPIVPNGFGNEMGPDKISAVMIYVNKKPPALTPEGYDVDGQIVAGVPYASEPLHGGVRIYKDDKLVDSLHRRNVVEHDALSTDPDGTQHFKLLDILRADGVDVRNLAEAWIIRDERRKEKLTAAQLADITFELGGRKQNAIYIGGEKLPAQVLALHSRPVRADQLPVILKEESDD